MDLKGLSPMMQHYMETKNSYPDCILFYRLGDFYEMFFDDAITVSKELELTLTGKECGLKERAPMCGVPFHSCQPYISRLIQKGYKVAIAEQMEDPKLAKGLVKREVIRVVTPGTVTGAESLEEGKNNYILSIFTHDEKPGIAAADISTGEFILTQPRSMSAISDEIMRLSPAEILYEADDSCAAELLEKAALRTAFLKSPLPASYFGISGEELIKTHFGVSHLDGLGLSGMPFGIRAAAALLKYLYETQKNSLPQMTSIRPYSIERYMMIDSATRRNLELLETMREKKKSGSLLGVLDKTKTAMGARYLRGMVEHPLKEAESIDKRLDAVEELCGKLVSRDELREYLAPVYDIERLIGRISLKNANARDLLAFKSSISMLPHIRMVLSEFSCSEIRGIYDEMDELSDLCSIIEAAISEDAPLTLHDGELIKPGYSEEADRLKAAGTEGKDWLAALESEERERTGIKNLRVKYNRVFGYYIEVTNSNKALVPDDYIRRQTLSNAERFTTPRLKELETAILGANDRLTALEYELFCQVRDRVAGEVERIQKTAAAVAKTDALCSLALAATENAYVRPHINTSGVIDIRGGRHPVVEQMQKDGRFIPNDTFLDENENRMMIITGPNMAGKSTYMRQTAIIALMAQMGSFVPAESADIGLSDRIFTRVGASDDLASGQSTFMVEMTEVSNILRNATKDSLIILDEIGRGTSTYDGLSIAWAVAEYILDTKKIGAKTLFATHYHEMTGLESIRSGAVNFQVAVREDGDEVIFLRRIMRGGADRSYGIQVARLAGVPEPVIKRASVILEGLLEDNARTSGWTDTSAKVAADIRIPAETSDSIQTPERTADPVQTEILGSMENLDLGNMTPIDAMNFLYTCQKKLKDRG